MDLEEVQSKLFHSLDELENIGNTLEYNALTNYCLLRHIINDNLIPDDNELAGFNYQNELIKKSVYDLKEKLKDICTQLRGLKEKALSGKTLKQDIKNLPISPYIKGIHNQFEYDNKKRYKKDDFKPIIEYCKISKDIGLSSYIIVIRNIPALFNYTTKNKKAKDTYCMLIYSGLHQPTKKIHNDTIKFISKLLKRKSFKIHNVEVATDFKDPKPINYKRKDEVKKALKKHTDPKEYIITGNTLYCNSVKNNHIKKLKIYDKYIKQKVHHKQVIKDNLNGWKRVEIELRPSKRMSFIEYIRSDEFRKDNMMVFDEISRLLKVSDFENTYLNYQINSFLDNRTINNKVSKRQYNSKDSIARFKMSEFKPYGL